MNTAILTVSPQGQITIPVEWRQMLDLYKGAQVVAYIREGIKKSLLLSPKPKSWTQTVAGTGANLWGNSDDYLKKERAEWN
ncbi:MAG: AbrB/MazE/SpoVT family DNA-binding domain-containing protein [Patescibacteria group bacterium]